jgi:putative ABC transport system permease protein
MLWQNFRISVRSLVRVPGFAATSILTVAAAVGMATSVFSVVNAVLVRPLPYKNAERLAVIWTSSANSSRGPVSFDDFEDWRRDSRTLESAALYTSYYKPILSGSGSAERLSALLVSHQYFAVMGVKPKLGRFFVAEEDREGRDDVVVLSYDLWRGKFQADPNVVGRSILLNSRPHTIVGVAGPDLLPLPPSMADEAAQIYRPVGQSFGPGSRDGRHLNTMVRLRPSVSIEQAQAELNVRCGQMARDHPDADAHLAARITGLRDDMTRSVRAPLLALQAAVLMLMLIACANVANLLLAKSSARRREMALRQALGAGIAQLTRMLLTESLALGVLGGLGGLVLAVWGTAGMTAIAARVLPDAGSISIDPRVFVFSLLLSLASSMLFGIAPIFWLRSVHIDDALKNGSRIAGDHRNGLRQGLAAVQIALALVLLVVTGLLGKSLLRLRNVNPGFDPQSVMTATVSLPDARYRDDAAVVQFFDRVLANLRVVPGVSEAAMVSVVPMSGDFDRTGFVIQGKQFGADEEDSPDRYIVSPAYFRALRIPLRQGRLFNAADDSNHSPACLISETAARLWFPGQSPLGQKIRAGSASGGFGNSPFREVVGVVGDIAQYGLGLPPTPQIYMPHTQFPVRSLTLMVRTKGEPGTVAAALRKVVFGVDPEQPLYDVKPLEEIVSNTIAARRLGVWLLAAFALSALALAAIGIYGVVSYSVARRTSEFGIRMALGARPADVARQAIGDCLWMVGAGLGAGLVASFATAKLIAGFLFGVSATDAGAFAILPLFLALVAVVACYLPARRAAKVDPMTALRFE